MAKIQARIEEHVADPRLVDERGPTKERQSKLRPSPINLALENRKLTQEQALAAEKFYKHWHDGGLVARIPSLDASRVFGGDGFQTMAKSEYEAFHRDRYRKAKAKLEDPKEGVGVIAFWVLEQIVCYERPFTEVGAVFGHKNRTRAAQVAFDMLSPGLNLLCKEWGIG